MKIGTFNCNSVRSRLPIILDWLADNGPDCLALQETKVVDAQFPEEAFADAGWKVFYRGQKSYNGVALVTRTDPDDVRFGLRDGKDGDRDSGPRLAHARFGTFHLLNAYVPQGRDLDSDMFAFKLDWLKRFRAYLEREVGTCRKKAVWVGDLNVAPEARDVYDSKKIWPHVCHSQPVIDAFRHVTDWGLEDVFRKHLPGEDAFTFWDYRVPKALERNVGWRIDHVLATPSVARASRSVRVDREARKREKPSDHTFVVAEFDL